LCGKYANKHCAQCKKRDYCSAEHQAEHWKVFGHGKECSQLLEEKLQNMTISSDKDREILSKSSYIFPEFEIITDVEEEVDPEEKQQEEEEMQEKIQSMIQTYEQEGEDDDKNDIEAEDTEVDKVFLNFQVVIKREPDQILRYARGVGSKPLWVNSKHILEEKDVPKCKYCGGERSYEFQILPQLLYKLKIEDRPDPMEWANLVAFTCKNSCSKPGTTYYEEVLYRQTD
jgi:pre-rRNA-processing protein TSR4